MTFDTATFELAEMYSQAERIVSYLFVAGVLTPLALLLLLLVLFPPFSKLLYVSTNSW